VTELSEVSKGHTTRADIYALGRTDCRS